MTTVVTHNNCLIADTRLTVKIDLYDEIESGMAQSTSNFKNDTARKILTFNDPLGGFNISYDGEFVVGISYAGNMTAVRKIMKAVSTPIGKSPGSINNYYLSAKHLFKDQLQKVYCDIIGITTTGKRFHLDVSGDDVSLNNNLDGCVCLGTGSSFYLENKYCFTKEPDPLDLFLFLANRDENSSTKYMRMWMVGDKSTNKNIFYSETVDPTKEQIAEAVKRITDSLDFTIKNVTVVKPIKTQTPSVFYEYTIDKKILRTQKKK